MIRLVIIVVVFCISVIQSPLSEANPEGSQYPPDIQKIIDRKTLRIGIYYKDKPPFVMTKPGGELYGIDITLAKNIAKALGVDPEFDRSSKTYKELHNIVARGKADIVICKFSRTYERAKNVRFSKPYLVFRQGLLLNRKFAAQKKIEKYPITYLKKNEFAIGVREHTSYVEYAREMFKKARIVQGKWEDIVDQVVKGEIDALLRDEYVMLKLLNQNPDMALYTSMYILKDKKDYIAMAVPVNSGNLLAFINIYLESNSIMLDADYLIREYPEVFEKTE